MATAAAAAAEAVDFPPQIGHLAHRAFEGLAVYLVDELGELFQLHLGGVAGIEATQHRLGIVRGGIEATRP